MLILSGLLLQLWAYYLVMAHKTNTTGFELFNKSDNYLQTRSKDSFEVSAETKKSLFKEDTDTLALGAPCASEESEFDAVPLSSGKYCIDLPQKTPNGVGR